MRIRTIVAAIGIAGALLAAAGIVLAVIAILPVSPGAPAFQITTGTRLVLDDMPDHAVWIRATEPVTGSWLATVGVVLASAGAVALLSAAAVGLHGITRLQRDTNGLV
jgi:hypothetical protein